MPRKLIRCQSLTHLILRAATGEEWFASRGRSWFAGRAHGVPKPKPTFSSALARSLFLGEVHLVRQWLPMSQGGRKDWKSACSFVTLLFVSLSTRIIETVSTSLSISCRRMWLQPLMPNRHCLALIIASMPFQCSSSFLEGISDYIDPGLPFISLSKGLELNTLRMMSQIIPNALKNPRQPFVALSGPSFALELMNELPTAMVVASKDKKLANAVQQLLASSYLRINTSSDVTGVEIAGALKNVLAIAAGIVEGMKLGNNSMAALVSQGCSEIRWLATKMGAKPTTITGLSGTGDIMLTCFVNLSRNRTVGVRLGSGEKLEDILGSMNQVAEGVSTAGAVIALAQKYNVKLPVLTAVARIIDSELTPNKAVLELMGLPQIEEV
ncbi:PREDICTED: glycerol-3-phosphate dehydrogenase [NAD(+)] 2, chloroplastic isoform X2 [Tarenaya hassleriana]|uniref:glycerol-3-phosphate dehydrogenase [NAD(+)] 2, chloroplastic isoform X2 n=1 Tax=Tarenaya hassleriana TaxID=28532 RepID=UPI00053C5B29|nr:PREDICTED: glycerol-3-phosphate dehydrogenase [NAD(+)] 2, chloroplastic isoform X2 [Tarenaya hassleriana]